MSDLLIISYGIGSPPVGTAKWPTPVSAGLLDRNVPVVAIDRQASLPVRMVDLCDLELAEPIAHGAEEWLPLLSNRIKRMCGTHERARRHFVDLYFALIQDEIARNASEIRGKLERYAGLFRDVDWSFAALLPLPQACIPISVASTVGAEYLCVDFAVWDGIELTVLILNVGDDVSLVKYYERLGHANVRIIEIPTALIRASDLNALRQKLGSSFFEFWKRTPRPPIPRVRVGLPAKPCDPADFDQAVASGASVNRR